MSCPIAYYHQRVTWPYSCLWWQLLRSSCICILSWPCFIEEPTVKSHDKRFFWSWVHFRDKQFGSTGQKDVGGWTCFWKNEAAYMDVYMDAYMDEYIHVWMHIWMYIYTYNTWNSQNIFWASMALNRGFIRDNVAKICGPHKHHNDDWCIKPDEMRQTCIVAPHICLDSIDF